MLSKDGTAPLSQRPGGLVLPAFALRALAFAKPKRLRFGGARSAGKSRLRRSLFLRAGTALKYLGLHLTIDCLDNPGDLHWLQAVRAFRHWCPPDPVKSQHGKKFDRVSTIRVAKKWRPGTGGWFSKCRVG